MTDIIHAKCPSADGKKDPNDFRDDPRFLSNIENIEESPDQSTWAFLMGLSVTNKLEEMESILKNSTFVIPEMAISGMTTLFYSWPNGGKTLMVMNFLIKGIREGILKAENILYINADDNYSGLYYKGRIAKKWGFNMISPAQNNMTPSDVIKTLLNLASSGEAEGKIIILDTLKKFADMMSKSSQASLYQSLRELNAKNATVLLLGHANKHLSPDGDLIYEGTADTLNDVDVAYAIYTLTDKTAERQIVEFRNIKDRGQVTPKVSYSYTKTQNSSYDEMIESVERLDDGDAQAARASTRVDALREKYASVIHFVTAVLEKGPHNESQILAAHKSEEFDTASEITRNALRAGLRELTGHDWDMNRLAAQNNAKVFNLKGAFAAQYRVAKTGEI